MTLKEFEDTYTKYIRTKPISSNHVYDTYGGYYKLYAASGLDPVTLVGFQLISEIYPDDVKMDHRYNGSPLSVSLNVIGDYTDKSVYASMIIRFPEWYIENKPELGSTLEKSGFHERWMGYFTSYSKSLYDLKDFEHYLNFIENLSTKILNYHYNTK